MIFAFKGTIAEKVLNALPSTLGEKVVIDSSIEAIDELVAHIQTTQPTFVLGMGEYSGKDTKHIRIETMCNTKFRNAIIAEHEIPIEPLVPVTPHAKLAHGIGNSWCNFVSVKIRIEAPSVPYTFLHIPKYFDITIANEDVQNMLPEELLGKLERRGK